MACGFLSTAGIPLLFTRAASAQIFSQPTRVGLESGDVIPVRYDEAEKIVVLPDETSPVTLTVAEDIRTSSGTVIIPEGSQIEGELRPTDDGTRFVAEELVLSGDRRFDIDATSDVITDTEVITQESDPDFLEGAAIGAGAAAVLAEIFGDIDFLDVLIGAGLGTLASILLTNEEEVEVVVIYPETDLDLTLQSDFALNR